MRKKELKKLVEEVKQSLDFIKRVQNIVEYWKEEVQKLKYTKKFDYSSEFQDYNSKLTHINERLASIEKRLKGK